MSKILMGWSALIGDKRYAGEFETDIDTDEFAGKTPKELEPILRKKLALAWKAVGMRMLQLLLQRILNEESVDEIEAAYKKKIKFNDSTA